MAEGKEKKYMKGKILKETTATKIEFLVGGWAETSEKVEDIKWKNFP